MSFYYQLLNRTVLEDGTQIAVYKPTIHTQGAWNPKEQHMAPATGVICSELEYFQKQFQDKKIIARISLDILGMIYLDEFSITTKIIRPGKTIELLESKFESKGKTCIIARTWRLQQENTATIEGIEDKPIENYKTLPYWKGMNIWGGGYIDSILNHVKVAQHQPGHSISWLTNDLEMVEGQDTSSFVKLMGMVDTMNGLAVRQGDKFEYAFPNVDLQLHLYRMPKGNWLGLEVQQQYGKDGIGLTSSVLHDENGSFGHAEQILTIRKMSSTQ
ncbi:MAG TPA: thioesterase family protein [Edaphocola sp.]|nr:thioesterase family protein [Edaphocola sp.]